MVAMGSIVGEVFTAVWEVWTEIIGTIFGAIWGAMPKVLSITGWVIAAVIVLPCVYVASHLYPKWVEWGEDF